MSKMLSCDVNNMSLEMFKRFSGIEEVDPHLEFRFGEPPLFSLSIYASMIVDVTDLAFNQAIRCRTC